MLFSVTAGTFSKCMTVGSFQNHKIKMSGDRARHVHFGKPFQGENHCTTLWLLQPLFKLKGKYTKIDCAPLSAVRVLLDLAVLITLRLVLGFALEYSSNNSIFLGVKRDKTWWANVDYCWNQGLITWLPTLTVSPLRMNLPVASFQRCERGFACPII